MFGKKKSGPSTTAEKNQRINSKLHKNIIGIQEDLQSRWTKLKVGDKDSIKYLELLAEDLTVYIIQEKKIQDIKNAEDINVDLTVHNKKVSQIQLTIEIPKLGAIYQAIGSTQNCLFGEEGALLESALKNKIQGADVVKGNALDITHKDLTQKIDPSGLSPLQTPLPPPPSPPYGSILVGQGVYLSNDSGSWKMFVDQTKEGSQFYAKDAGSDGFIPGFVTKLAGKDVTAQITKEEIEDRVKGAINTVTISVSENLQQDQQEIPCSFSVKKDLLLTTSLQHATTSSQPNPTRFK